MNSISVSITFIDEIRHSKLTRKISTDPVQESLTLPKLVLKTQEVSWSIVETFHNSNTYLIPNRSLVQKLIKYNNRKLR